ncbi:kyphoscoliosis peptidase-like [Denticeps clupeoides]|uniref:kyphoscoliosis peptidase-like n=1 Tax=Denticeps clupeoides TaxID=299321 RepID=UPI0010A3F428|nr:kyphoscoliosis peptidase-like [Denticeps clupeoides]
MDKIFHLKTISKDLHRSNLVNHLPVLSVEPGKSSTHLGQKTMKGGAGNTDEKGKKGTPTARGSHAITKQRGENVVPRNPGRKSREDLFPSEDVFCSIDARVVRAGEELRSQKIFSVEAVTRVITQGAANDLQKLRCIWVWICHNIEYDVSGYLGLSEKLCSPERVMEAGRGVCSGYSGICRQMCREVGIECREVPGHGKGIGYRQGQSYQENKSSHVWNAVHLGGQWYLLDACWGAGRVDLDNQTFIKRFDNFYFLVDPENFINSHYPDEPEWQLLEQPITQEEFEKTVLRTSEFYRLGLTLLHPQHFLLVTEKGEGTISMGSSQPLDFMYQAYKQSGNEDKVEVNVPIGLLTVTKSSMKLHLVPPTLGTFNIMVFARPIHAPCSFHWICSFLLECPEPKDVEELPENPFLSWGFMQNSRNLGLMESNCRTEAIQIHSGSFELSLQTTRPLTMVCELSHKNLDQTLARRCLLTQIQPDRLTCHVLCPYAGYYRLSLFVRDYENHDERGYKNAANLLLHCTGGAVNLNQLFPPGLSASCGPGIRTLSAGLSNFSHTSALLFSKHGNCNISFHNQRDLDIHAVLSKEQCKQEVLPFSRYVLLTHNKGHVTISVTLPEPGVYKLSLYGQAVAADQDFNLLCDFVVKNRSETTPPCPFPSIYSAWRKGCVLLEPRSGLLQPQAWVRFGARVPGARRVSVQGAERTDLQLNASGAWEGRVFTGRAGTQLKLAAAWPGTGDMAVLMAFDVLGPQGIAADKAKQTQVLQNQARCYESGTELSFI